MESRPFEVINEFPLQPDGQKFLMYYTVRSTRVTLVCAGTCHILLYSDRKRIKTFRLPDAVTCATIINTPLAKQDISSVTHMLICGTSKGSIFVLSLPSTKDELSDLKKRNCDVGPGTPDLKQDVMLVYRYAGLKLHSIACIDGHLLMIAKDGKEDKLMLFQPAILQDAVCRLQNDGETKHVKGMSGTCEIVSLQPPSISCSSDSFSPNMVLFHLSESHNSPFFISLDCVQNLDKGLYKALFGGAIEPIACFFYPDGHTWYLPISSGGRLDSLKFNKLQSLQEECFGVVTVLLGSEFFVHHTGKNAEKGSSKVGIMILGKDQRALILYHNVAVPDCDQNLETVCLAYSSEVKSFVSKWNNLVSCAEVFLCCLSKLTCGINVTSRLTTFGREKQIGMKSNWIWALQDFEDHTCLISVKLSDLWSEHSFSESPPSNRIQDLLSELNALDFKHKELEKDCNEMTNVLKTLNCLASKIGDKETGFLRLELTHNVVKFSDLPKLLINFTVSKASESSILDAFFYDLQASAHVENSRVGHTHSFHGDFQHGKKDNLCVLVESDELDVGNQVRINVCFVISGLKNVDALPKDVMECLDSGFPIIIPFFSKCVQVS